MMEQLGKLVAATILITFLVGVGVGYCLRAVSHKCGERMEPPAKIGVFRTVHNANWTVFSGTNQHELETRFEGTNWIIVLDGVPVSTNAPLPRSGLYYGIDDVLVSNKNATIQLNTRERMEQK